ncbi:hypothetical protein, partial [Pseudomonas juntendi]|uniref:hypothetical protein n=1 Tax=Pseudomonas juntendi TaxID=2666183 RepID=UPI001E5E73C0
MAFEQDSCSPRDCTGFEVDAIEVGDSMVSGKGSRSIFSACEIERRPRGAIASCARSYVCFGPII